jgi:hypothetical protein
VLAGEGDLDTHPDSSMFDLENDAEKCVEIMPSLA